jgi:hypothetical protein
MENEEKFTAQLKGIVDDVMPVIFQRLDKNTWAKLYLVMCEVDSNHEVKYIKYHGRTIITPELANSQRVNFFPKYADFYLKSANIFDTDGLVKTATTYLVKTAQDAKKKEEHEKNMRLKAAAKRDEIRQQFEKVNADAKEREGSLSKKITHLEEQLSEKTKEAEHFKELYGKTKAVKPIPPPSKDGGILGVIL